MKVFTIFTPHQTILRDEIQEKEMDGHVRVWKRREMQRPLVGKFKGKKSLGNPRHR